MEAVFTLKRVLEINYKLCISCQKRNKPKDDIRETTDYSKTVVCEAKVKRRNLRDVMRCDERDVNNREVIDPLDPLYLGGAIFRLYGIPTVMLNIYIRAKKKLKAKSESSLQVLMKVIKLKELECRPVQHAVRLSQFIGKNVCFAGWKSLKERSSAVRSDQILEVAPFHFKVRLRVEACNLIAVGAKYHLACFAFFPKIYRESKICSKRH